METTALLRARVPAQRLKRTEKIFARLGMKPSDAVNLFLAQVELHKGLPFAVTTQVGPDDDGPLLAKEEIAARWNEAFGEY